MMILLMPNTMIMIMGPGKNDDAVVVVVVVVVAVGNTPALRRARSHSVQLESLASCRQG